MESVIYEIRDRIAYVTINRPEKANALNFVTLSELEHVAHSFRDDIETRVVIRPTTVYRRYNIQRISWNF